ncbi:MAG: thioredoxin family protein [Candidatus Dependentiae bacterium]|nr:thioredoxin family protein [Candidatus Dependentiae bacterium]
MVLCKKARVVFGFVCLIFMTSAGVYSHQTNSFKELLEVADSTFKKEILDSPIPVILAVISKGSNTCRLVEPLFSEIHKELHGRGKVVIMNLEKNLNFAKELGVVTTPVLIFYNKGKRLGTLELTMSPAEIKSIVKYVLGLNIFTSLGYYRLLMKLLGKIA